MTLDPRSPNPERDQTDESLRVEREVVDLALGDELAAVDDTADAVIDKARARADEVLARARANTDRQTVRVTGRSSAIVEKTRSLEDQAVRQERADADESLRIEREEHVALLSVERDETDKDLLSERARSDDALATRDAFLGVVSHDLRNMLSSIIGFAALIAKDAAREDKAERILRLTGGIQRSGARMNRLIGDLVDVASIDAGALAVAREVGDPAHVVAEAVDAFQTQASARAVSLVAEIDPRPVLVAFDPARILQVLTNLLSNAIKFTPAGGSVVVSVRGAPDEVVIAVSDTGPGIPSDQLEAVFARFVQVTKNDRRGVGLGLYISRSIVQGHGGRIWAENRTGEGATFSFTLPTDVPMPGQGASGAGPA
jgi:signal transduction histidine kinase